MKKAVIIKCEDSDVINAIVEYFQDIDHLNEEFLGDRICETAGAIIDHTEIHTEEEFTIVTLIV